MISKNATVGLCRLLKLALIIYNATFSIITKNIRKQQIIGNGLV